jgi:L-threonylcarbamoyladenylate synthase
VRKIFAAKGRPSTNPLIVHVADRELARRYAGDWPGEAEILAERFWPGPLTLVVPKTDAIVAEVTAGLPTVGLRCPNHDLTLRMLREFDGPVAGPSANRSTHVSPTDAQHVRDDLGEAVDMVLDGGRCVLGIESTVLDVTGKVPRILRLGGVSPEMIEQLIGKVEVFRGVVQETQAASGPGMQGKHYAPRTPAYRFHRQQWERVRAKCEESGRCAVIFVGEGRGYGDLAKNIQAIEMPASAAEYAVRLYATLRDVDRRGLNSVWIEMPPQQPQWAAVRDRLTRATQEL